ncbi:globin domain-containing protein [Streptomyces sp. NL15-2K]|uniref:globin domain-containing protein n=1 Tax=Streptomyces sp. NL15-2K TaxID=376149 RepID=UPI000FF92ECE|nr:MULTISPECIES: globin domain-containing protein [Actinomycetes]WKX10708.1 FAD-binding oxidoreductase [Kutzneria buriramensis]GCB47746.1 flavohemoprotein [Streptomyces sp. NL15-2K]
MDAPTTTPADNGTSGGGGGWFTPRKQPAATSGSDEETAEGRRLAAMRPVGRTATGTGTNPSAEDTAPPASTTGDAPQPGQAAGEPQPTVAAGHRRHSGATADVQPASTGEPAPIQASAISPSISAQSQAPATQAPPAWAPQAPPAQAPSTEPPPAEQRVPAQRAVPPGDASPDAVLIRRTMAEVGPVADKVTSYFYALLFVRHPDLRSLFPAAMDTQRDRLLKALLTAAEHIDNTDVLVDYLQNLGRGHRKYGTRAEHYPAVGECLIGALSKYAAGIWTAETEAAWVRTYTTISQVMIDAAAADEMRAPAWWYAEVVSHDLRTQDVAVVTVRPDQPYPFLAGQYASVETPWWPRIWRHYSFASAPRSDGLLSFHVKAVPAGWVSNALVHRARPGDIIRLGPPAGSMTVDHTTDSGLLCLGGGTGIAPIKALVEDVAEHGERRPVEVFYGARTDHDLYDIDTMLRLQQSHPWLSVRAVVDQQAHLQLPDAVREYGPWNEYDAYLSGPPGMIRSGVDALRDIGVPSERIRHDSVEELVATAQ